MKAPVVAWDNLYLFKKNKKRLGDSRCMVVDNNSISVSKAEMTRKRTKQPKVCC